MSVFEDEEIEYLKSQLLGRLATVGPDGQPHVVAVSFCYNAQLDTIDIGGHDFARGRHGLGESVAAARDRGPRRGRGPE
jgi:PPOX class F420-dependent enzyme/OxyR family protein